MNYLDLIFGGLLIYGLVKGFIKGFIIEVSSLIALIFGFVGSLLFIDNFNNWLRYIFGENNIPPKWILFIIIFAIIIYLTSLIAKYLTKLIKIAFLGGINRFFGAIFGILKMLLILSALVLIIDQFSFIFKLMDQNVIEDSLIYKPIKEFGIKFLEYFLNEDEWLPKNL